MHTPAVFLRRLAAVAVLLSASGTLLAQQVTIPEGTVIELRMDSGLSSENARVNDPFKATVLRAVVIDGRVAVPEMTTVDGRVTMVQPAERSSRSGVIGVAFTQLTVGGKIYPIEGTLTSLRADERKQIIDEESQVTGQSSASRNILFIGGGAGVGAAVGAIAGGGKGAGIGGLAGGGLGVLGALFSHGAEAQVPAGSEVAMQLVREVTVNADTRPRQRAANDRTLYAAADMVRGAQTALQQRKYYSGPINGRLDDPTRRAITRYQIDNRQSATGDLDESTAVSLGIMRSGGDPRPSAGDPRPSGSAANRQLALDITRKGSSLLTLMETTLGVRVDDIRARPQNSESDLDLLLQLQSFTKASIWYEQASRNGNNNGREALDNCGRVLLRSAHQVDLSMETASDNRRIRDAWASIKTSLSQINLDESAPRRGR